MLKNFQATLFKTGIFLILVFFSNSLTAQEKELLEKIEILERTVGNLNYELDKVLKSSDDVILFDFVKDIAYTDKVRLTGPAAKIFNPTAKGAGNPLVFWSYIFIPKDMNFDAEKAPLVVLVHGGVHGNFGLSNKHILRELLAQGYVVAAPEYRGSTGYGRAFQRKIDYGGKEIDDTKALRDYMVDNYSFIDENRVGVMGWSHGGMHALLNAFRFPESYNVAFAGVPVSDLIMRMGAASPSYRKLFSGNHHIGKEPYQDIKEYRKRSPAFNAHKLEIPLMVFANTNDDDVLIEEVEHLISALKANQKDFEYEIFEEIPGGHHFDRIDTKFAKETRLRMYRFLADHLKPKKSFKNVKELNNASYLFQQ